MTLAILNDLHLGVLRTGGTTPQTAWQLRQYLLQGYSNLLDEIDGDLMILGDMFDTGRIPLDDMMKSWKLTVAWLERTGSNLVLVNGNHDCEKSSLNLSSFTFFCRLLTEQFARRVLHVEEPTDLAAMGYPEIYVVPHVANSEIFKLAIAAVPPCKYLALHANFSSPYAEHSDHSLNLSADQAEAVACERIIIAHEHQRRTELNGKVLVMGNQLPSSVSDCLGNSTKQRLVIHFDKLEWLPTWEREGSFVQLDWEELNETSAQFVRVVGEASAEDAARVVANISKFRSRSKALVITNAVQIEGVQDGEQLQVTLEQVKAFDIMEALMKYLDEREQAVVKKLLKEHS